jgi:Right handed beta helix region
MGFMVLRWRLRPLRVLDQTRAAFARKYVDATVRGDRAERCYSQGNTMKKHELTIAIMGGICALALSATATPAGAGTAYLSHTGSGGTCTLTSPCNFMNTALAVAGPNGEVICLDKGNYSGSTISDSVTISCGDGLWENGSGNFINTSAGSDVVIEGLVSDSGGSGATPIIMSGQGALHLRRVRIGHSSGSALGLSFTPSGPATLHIIDSVFYNNGGSGVLVKPGPGASANVHMRNVRFEHNLHGLFADGTNGVVNVNIAESAFVDNQQNGIGAFSPGSAVTVSVTTSQINGNFANGIGSANNAAVKIGNSQITGNANGLAVLGAGQILTLGGNHLHSNLSNGTFTGSIPTQ